MKKSLEEKGKIQKIMKILLFFITHQYTPNMWGYGANLQKIFYFIVHKLKVVYQASLYNFSLIPYPSNSLNKVLSFNKKKFDSNLMLQVHFNHALMVASPILHHPWRSDLIIKFTIVSKLVIEGEFLEQSYIGYYTRLDRLEMNLGCSFQNWW